MDQKKIGSFLKELRKEKGITQEEFEAALKSDKYFNKNTHRNIISDIDRNEGDLTKRVSIVSIVHTALVVTDKQQQSFAYLRLQLCATADVSFFCKHSIEFLKFLIHKLVTICKNNDFICFSYYNVYQDLQKTAFVLSITILS